MNKTLDRQTETEVVAYIARGDEYSKIIQTLHERGIDLTKGTISNIKKRNADALSYMQGALVEHQLSHATSILRKSRELLERKLDKQLDISEEYATLKQSYMNGDISSEDYFRYLERLDRRELTATELNSITKESFNQSQVEQGKPSSITESPTQARANLQTLLTAIAQGDDQAVIKAIFPDD